MLFLQVVPGCKWWFCSRSTTAEAQVARLETHRPVSSESTASIPPAVAASTAHPTPLAAPPATCKRLERERVLSADIDDGDDSRTQTTPQAADESALKSVRACACARLYAQAAEESARVSHPGYTITETDSLSPLWVACVCVRAHARVGGCVLACVRACVCVCLCARVCVRVWILLLMDITIKLL